MSEEEYPIEYRLDRHNIHRYFFVSEGDDIIVKVVSISPLKFLEGRIIFNFGFCDYDTETGTTFPDTKISDNGDTKKVFSTVLATIPAHFMKAPRSILSVRGSDSRTDYPKECELTCKKSCREREVACENIDRRIKIYRRFLNRNYDRLSKDYVFLGIIDDINNDPELYVPGKEYLQILFHPKK